MKLVSNLAMFPLRKLFCVSAVLGPAILAVNPVNALTTGPVPIANANAVVPVIPGSTGLNSLGFNQANFASVWSSAPANFIPQLTDVRLFVKGILSGTFTVKNTDTTSSITVNSPALTFKVNSNGLNTGDLSTTNTTGVVGPATSSTTTTNDFTNPPGTPPGPPPTSECSSGWQAGQYINSPPFVNNLQIWNCSTTTITPTTQTFTINTPSSLTATNWSLIGGQNTYGLTSSFWSGNTVAIPTFFSLSFPSFTPSSQTAAFTLNGSGTDNYIQYTYQYVNAQVPAPIPVLGAGLAFGFSRRLRRRINSSTTNII